MRLHCGIRAGHSTIEFSGEPVNFHVLRSYPGLISSFIGKWLLSMCKLSAGCINRYNTRPWFWSFNVCCWFGRFTLPMLWNIFFVERTLSRSRHKNPCHLPRWVESPPLSQSFFLALSSTIPSARRRFVLEKITFNKSTFEVNLVN